MTLSPKAEKQINTLVPHLLAKTMKPMDMIECLGLPVKASSYNRLTILINAIGARYPLYEPCPHQYKILTDEDLEEYRKQLQEKKQKCLKT